MDTKGKNNKLYFKNGRWYYNSRGMVRPYCGQCGHVFYGEKKIHADMANLEATNYRCIYCLSLSNNSNPA